MDLLCNLTEFFHEAVQSALKNQRVETAELTEFYLVNLLSQYCARSRFDEQPLALKMAEAMEAEGVEQRAQKLRDIGDTSLYLSGFFAESIERRLLDLDYYVDMGGAAYRHLSHIARFSREASFFDAYTELSDKFRALVSVLNEISQSHAFATPGGAMKLYERWTRTRDEDLEKRLRDHGLMATRHKRELS